MDFGVDTQVLRSFQQELRNYLPVIQETARSARSGDSRIETVREMARTIGSAAAVLGLSDLHEAASEVEGKLNGEDRSSDEAFLSALACLECFSAEEFEGGDEPDFDFNCPEMALWAEEEHETRETAKPVAAAEKDEILSEEMLEVYQMESEEHLTLVAQHLRELEGDLSRRDLVQEVRRSIHTLKGAAAMVGLRTAGALAKTGQDFLDQVCDGVVELTPEVLKLLENVAAVLDKLARVGVPDDALRSRARTLREQMGALLELGAEDISKLAQAVSPPPPAKNERRPDEIASDELFEIFQAEAEEQLDVAVRCLRALERYPAQRDVVQELRRSIHTLKGAAGMVGLNTAACLAHRAEDLLDELYEGAIHPSAEALQLLFAVTDMLQDLSRAGVPGEQMLSQARQLEDAFGDLHEADGGAEAPPDPAFELDGLAEEEPSQPADTPERSGSEPLDQAVSGEMLEVCQSESDEHLTSVSQSLRHLERESGNPDSVAPEADLAGLPEEPQALEEAPEPELDLALPPVAEAPEPAFEEPASAAPAPEPARKPPAREAESAPPPRPAVAASSEASLSGQFVRVPVERVDELVRLVSELVVHRSTLEQQYSRYSRELGEHDLTTGRLRRLAVRLEDDFASRALLAVQSSKSLPHRPIAAPDPVQGVAGEFDELEFDRYSEFHLLSRDVTETASDLVSAGVQLRSVGEDFRQALHRFGRVTGQVQDLLMRMRMMQVGSIENRLHRTVRFAASRRDKNVRFVVVGSEVELDKTLLAEITGPLEHILRNAVDHGLESPAERVRRGKPEQGTVTLEAALDGHRAVLRISDDGRGLDASKIRTRAVETGRFSSAQVDEMDDGELFELIFQPGFTTASEVSEISGRGVGLDAVRAAVAKLGGSISIESKLGAGAAFMIGLPTSLAVTRVLLIESAGRRFCIPAHAVDKVARGRITPAVDGERRASVEIDGRRLPAYRLSDALHLHAEPDTAREQPILVVEAGERRYGLAVDLVMEARDAVVKSLGPLLEGTPGISSATVLGDGSVALILNPAELPDAEARIAADSGQRSPQEAGLHVLMADDSISVRRVLIKTLESAGWRYTAARDGQDALEKLRELDRPPDVALLDVEMPRMDGFQLTSALRTMPEYRSLPIVMLTSRAGEKHRRKAAELGANDYLVKPYIEDVLLSALRRAARAGRRAAA